MRNYRNEPVKDVPSEELLFELLKRGMVQDAPSMIEMSPEYKIMSVGIGADHTADVVIDGDALVELDRLIAMHNKL